ncbi:hypothetical protein HQ585_16325 [candidate division KSB1 bacterium]|nr:hypothetical protein [candidate division KSB1 bacterium]
MDALERENLLQIIRKQIVLYPKFDVQDMYKMCYQVTQGGIHYINEMATARIDLSTEWRGLKDPFFNESLIENIDPRQKLIRVNLRPFKEQGGTPEQILNLFERSLKETTPDESLLKQYWDAAIQMVDELELPFTKNAIREFWDAMQENGFPPVRHSNFYRKMHQPAYRLVLLKYWEGKDQDV